jgi:hypothetical protein
MDLGNRKCMDLVVAPPEPREPRVAHGAGNVVGNIDSYRNRSTKWYGVGDLARSFNP